MRTIVLSATLGTILATPACGQQVLPSPDVIRPEPAQMRVGENIAKTLSAVKDDFPGDYSRDLQGPDNATQSYKIVLSSHSIDFGRGHIELRFRVEPNAGSANRESALSQQACLQIATALKKEIFSKAKILDDPKQNKDVTKQLIRYWTTDPATHNPIVTDIPSAAYVVVYLDTISTWDSKTKCSLNLGD